MSPHDYHLVDAPDRTVEALVEYSLAPLVDLLPPEDLAELRLLTTDLLMTHPVITPIVHRIRPRPLEESGKVAIEGPDKLLERWMAFPKKTGEAAR